MVRGDIRQLSRAHVCHRYFSFFGLDCVSLALGAADAGVVGEELPERVMPITNPAVKIGLSGEAIGQRGTGRIFSPVVDGAVTVFGANLFDFAMVYSFGGFVLWVAAFSIVFGFTVPDFRFFPFKKFQPPW